MTGVFPAGLEKEVRALLPAFAACMLAVTAGALSDDQRIGIVAIFAYSLGALAIGAHSVGHEYSCHTLGTLLAQPVDRRRVYATKLGVLAVMLVALGAMAWQLLYVGKTGRHLSLLPAICGLCLAPWFTMLCRNAMAGAVFSVVLPLSLLLAGDLIGAARYGGIYAADVDRFKFGLLWWGTLAACAVAAVGGWRTFMRLESIEGAGAQIELPRWLGGRSASRAHRPVRALVRKELHLQQMTLVVVLIYLCAWAAMSIAGRTTADLRAPLAALHLGVLSILIGSLASAEERVHNTIEWQMLAPMAGWQQFSIKAGMAIGLALLLGLGLPLALNVIHENLRAVDAGWAGILVAVLLTVSSLYVSSLCSSGLKAIVLALPIGLAAYFVAQGIYAVVEWFVFDLEALSPLARTLRGRVGAEYATYSRLDESILLVMAAVYTCLLLRFAFLNHRSAERGLARVWPQALWIAGLVTLTFVLLSTLFRAVPNVI